MRHLFIINPAAGKGKALRYRHAIEKYFEERGEDVRIALTEEPGHATCIARDFAREGSGRIYAVGGDGTLNEVLNGMAGTGCSLAVLPAGSGNDFFRNLEAETDETLLARTIEGREEPVSLGEVEGRYFLNVASAGIDAAIAHNADRYKKLPLVGGTAAYVAGIFHTVFFYRSFPAVVRIDGESFSRKTLLLAVANGRCYGGGMKIAPGADIRSGEFEVYHVDEAGPFRILHLFPRLMAGTHESIREVSHAKGGQISIEAERAFPLNIDGEIRHVRKAEFRIIPEGVRLVVPARQMDEGEVAERRLEKA